MLNVLVRDATDAFDHILIGAPDLEVGIRWVEKRTGVQAKFGRESSRGWHAQRPAVTRCSALSGNHRARPSAIQCT